MNNPLVSVIMNCYNSDQYLQEAIESIYAQTYSNWEIIFWDNASIDDSAKIAKSYDERIKYYLASETTSLGEDQPWPRPPAWPAGAPGRRGPAV